MLTPNRLTFAAAAVVVGLGFAALPSESEAGSYFNYGYGNYGGYGSSHVGIGYSTGYRHYGGYRPYSRYSYGGHYGYRPYYGRSHYRHRRHHYRHGNDEWIPFAILGGLIGAVALSEAFDNDDRYDRYESYDRYGRSRGYSNPAGNLPCHEVHKIDRINGRDVKLAGTMCYDENGRAYIVSGSQRVIEAYN